MGGTLEWIRMGASLLPWLWISWLGRWWLLWSMCWVYHYQPYFWSSVSLGREGSWWRTDHMVQDVCSTKKMLCGGPCEVHLWKHPMLIFLYTVSLLDTTDFGTIMESREHQIGFRSMIMLYMGGGEVGHVCMPHYLEFWWLYVGPIQIYP